MQAIILAAGESSRFWPLNKKHKSLVYVCGKTVIEWTIDAVRKANVNDIIIIQGPDKSIEKEIASRNKDVKFVVQKEAKGMGNAVMQAEKFIKEDFIVFNPNQLEVKYFLDTMLAKKKETNAGMILLGDETDEPEVYAILKLDGDKCLNLIEKPSKKEAPSNIRVKGIYLLPKDFPTYYKKVKEHMYAFEDALALYMKENDAYVAIVKRETPSLKYPWHLLKITNMTLGYKKNQVNKVSSISKSAIIKDSYIGKNVKIYENAVIKNSYIGDNVIIGNNAVVRDSSIEEDCMIGANAEVAKSLFQKDIHMHTGYIGDTVIGKGTRIGTGFTTANRRIDRGNIKATVKGEKKDTMITFFGCIIGEDSQIGINVSTMPGVMIGSNCIIGPNTQIMENILDNTKYYVKQEIVKKKAN